MSKLSDEMQREKLKEDKDEDLYNSIVKQAVSEFYDNQVWHAENVEGAFVKAGLIIEKAVATLYALVDDEGYATDAFNVLSDVAEVVLYSRGWGSRDDDKASFDHWIRSRKKSESARACDDFIDFS